MLHLIQAKPMINRTLFTHPLTNWTSRYLKSLRATEKHLEQGATLLEALVAIVILTTVIAISTPPILLATATRIQNRRAEQAMQLAQQEIERVRLIVDQGQYADSDLPPAASDSDLSSAAPAGTSLSDPDNIKHVAAPSGSSALCTSSCTATQASSQGDFIVQVFRVPGVTQAGVGPGGANQVVAFRMGVRVYSNAAAAELSNGGSLGTTPASLQLTSSQGQQSQLPLAVLYADFTRGDLTGTLDSYRQFLN